MGVLRALEFGGYLVVWGIWEVQGLLGVLGQEGPGSGTGKSLVGWFWGGNVGVQGQRGSGVKGFRVGGSGVRRVLG